MYPKLPLIIKITGKTVLNMQQLMEYCSLRSLSRKQGTDNQHMVEDPLVKCQAHNNLLINFS